MNRIGVERRGVERRGEERKVSCGHIAWRYVILRDGLFVWRNMIFLFLPLKWL